jgi:endonuclease/exonuclease/phosphatase family metal-dependent hydrolase
MWLLLAANPVDRTPEPAVPYTRKKGCGGARRRRVWVVVLALCVALYAAYAGRRTPVEPQRGVGISWPADCRPISKTPFRVATYNIHRGKGTDGIRDLKRTAGVLREADIVGLNEVGGPAFWGRSNQAKQLGQSMKIGWLFAPNQRRWHMYHFGNGLLSRFAVEEWTSEPLVYSKTKSRSHRNLITAQVQVGQQPVTVMVTHLDRGEIRPTQLKDVLDEFCQYQPAILMGDFNSEADDPLLVEFFADSNNVDAIEATLGDAGDGGRIDWIITRGVTVLSGGMEPKGISDHPCYWVDVEVPATNTGSDAAAGER